MKKFVVSMAVLALAACSESPTGVEMAPQFSKGNAFHTLETPVLADAVVTPASVTLTWTPLFSQLQTQCDGLALANELSSIEDCRNEHFELFRNGVKIADVRGNEYADSDVVAGASYSYYVKSMGMEQEPGSREEAFTYHSLPSNTVEVTIPALSCAAPTVTSSISGAPAFTSTGPNEYTKLNSSAMITLAGSTENLIGCPGARAEYRVVARNTNNFNVMADFTMADWASLLPHFDGSSYSIVLPITRNNKNVVYEFLVRVSHDDSETETPASTPTVTIVD